MTAIRYRTADVDGLKVFYREAGAARRARSCCCCTASRAPATCSAISSRCWPTASTSSPPTCRASANPTCRRGATSPTRSTSIADVIDRFTEVVGLEALRALRLRLRRADRLPARGQASRAHHRDHLAERQRLRGGAERRLEPDPGLLAGAVAGQSRGAPRLPRARDDALAVHPRRARRDDGLSGRLLARQLLSGRPGADEIQLDLFGDYKSNVALYPAFQSISAPTSRRSWRCGARTTRSSCRRAPRRSSATFPTRTCASSTPATSRWRRTPRRSPRPSATSSRSLTDDRAPDRSQRARRTNTCLVTNPTNRRAPTWPLFP